MRMIRALLIGILLVAIYGCTGVQGGNENSVIVNYISEQQAFDDASAHCAKYGRKARLTQLSPFGQATFDCIP
jgi:hypothetical protein